MKQTKKVIETKEHTVLVAPGTIVKVATKMDTLLQSKSNAQGLVALLTAEITAHKVFLKSELEKG